LSRERGGKKKKAPKFEPQTIQHLSMYFSEGNKKKYIIFCQLTNQAANQQWKTKYIIAAKDVIG